MPSASADQRADQRADQKRQGVAVPGIINRHRPSLGGRLPGSGRAVAVVYNLQVYP